jgi:protein gp37
MGENSNIPWTDDTFNTHWGCTKVAPECQNCYAEKVGKRFGTSWGPKAFRRFFGDKHWNEPRKWQRRAEKEGRRRRVFCGSMCDVFEGRDDLNEHRERLWTLIEETPNLDWLLLTKRPENMQAMLPGSWLEYPRYNVWLGTTSGTQKSADKNIPHLLNTPALVHFVSCEPILEPVNFEAYFARAEELIKPHYPWVIVGDESGYHRRPAKIEWVRDIQKQCEQAGVPFFFKQFHRPSIMRGDRDLGNVIKVECPDLDGKAYREFPHVVV